GVAKLSYSGLTAGHHQVTAVYGGDDNYAGHASSVRPHTVSKATTTLSLVAAPATAAIGHAVTLTATGGSDGAAPTGTVTVKEGATVLGTKPLAGNPRKAVLAIDSLKLGAHTITASYNVPNNNFLTSTGSTAVTINANVGNELAVNTTKTKGN